MDRWSRPAGVHQFSPVIVAVAGRVHGDRLPTPSDPCPVGTHHHDRGVGIGQKPAGLVGREVGVDPQPHRSQSLCRQEGLHEGGLVRQRACDPVSGSDAERREATGGSGHPEVQLGVGEDTVSPYEGVAVRVVTTTGLEAGGYRGRTLGEGGRSGTYDEAVLVDLWQRVGHDRRG